MKKVLIFSLAYFPHVGGAEVAIKELTDRIQDIEFHMVTMRFSPAELQEEKIGNVYVHRIGSGNASKISKFLFQFQAAREAFTLHEKNSYDAVWAMMAHSAGVPAVLFKKKYPRVPMLLSLQEGDPPRQIERTMLPLWPWFSRAFTCADRVQAISNFLGEWARTRGFTGPLSIIPNGWSKKEFSDWVWFEQNPIGNRKVFWENNGGGTVLDEDKILITTSRLVYKNGIDTVIESLEYLPPNVKFFILGDGPLRSNLTGLVQKLGLDDRIRFLGQVSNTKVGEYLHASNMFIRPSRSEGMGNSFIEAMAAGIPVIGTAVGGIPDFLTDGKTGFVVEVDNPKSIAMTVQHILENPTRTQEVVQNAKELSAQYDWDMLAERMRQEAFEPLWQKQ
ncbi:glycosyltransferase family 4 protein [Patescibacteria group bacterium]|nr:glycosyltransferase family 4 protein [Patescibacteria group bacterium]